MTSSVNYRQKLFEFKDEQYRDFHAKICPDIDKELIIGVRVPNLRKFAREIVKTDAVDYLENAPIYYYEEKVIFGLVLGLAKLLEDERMKYFEKFAGFCDSWAVCDLSCGAFKFINNNPEKWLKILLSYRDSSKEYEVRLCTVCLMNYYLTDEYKDTALENITAVSHTGYYAQMAVSWALSTAFIKYPYETENYLSGGTLSPFVQNMTVSKIKDSRRVNKQTKQYLNKYKVKI